MTYNNRADIVSFNGMRDEGRIPFKVKKGGERKTFKQVYLCSYFTLMVNCSKLGRWGERVNV